MLHGDRFQSRFYNYGLIGNYGESSFEWPISTGNEYAGDFSPLLGVEFIHPSGDTLRSVITPDGPRGNSDGPPGGGAFWGFESLPGFAASPPVNADRSTAMSDDPDTWPPSWPGKPDNWNGQWIGPQQPGVPCAAQEAYFQMDDNSDLEWRERNGQILYPFPNDTSRGGIGLRVEVRHMLFDQPEYEDALVVMYIIHNDGVVNIERARFGFVVGTLAGGRQDSQDDMCAVLPEWDMVVSYDSDDIGSPGWVPVSAEVHVGKMGVMFLETPQNLGMTSFEEFYPPGAVRMRDDAALWTRTTPGRIIEPLAAPADGDFIMATGDFPLLPGEADTVIAAVVFGATITDLEIRAAALQALCDEGFHLDASIPVRGIPQDFAISAVYPNPFNSSTQIEFTLPTTQRVSLRLFDIMGREAIVLVDETKTAGTHRITVNGSGLSSGIYFCCLQAGTEMQTQKIILLK